MFDLNLFLDMALKEMENPNLFPFPFGLHVGFAVISLVFFIYRFATDKRPFQLIMAIAMPFSMSIWLTTNRTWFYVVGAVELVLIIAALVTVFVCKRPETEEKTDENSEDTATSADTADEETASGE